MSRAALITFALVAFIALASASRRNYEAKKWEGTPTEAEVCEQVGIISGCSGCVHGTKNFCTWVQFPQGGGKKRGDFESLVQYGCIPRADVLVFEATNDYVNTEASSLCPADATKEPMIRHTFITNGGPLGTFEKTSVIFSSYHDSPYVDFPTQPWAVDRTSFYAPLGANTLNYGYGEDSLNCSYLTSADDVRLQVGPGYESDVFNGYYETELDKYCARVSLAAFISSRCPKYGAAVSGICVSYFDQIYTNCHEAANLGPNTGNGGTFSSAFEAYYVVPDATPYCLNSFPLYPSGVMDSAAGLHGSYAEYDD